MVNSPSIPQHNPLASFMRQPKIYIQLPSQGEFWPSGSLQVSENGQFPVYSMTAKDELMLKIPDAIMSGQAVVDVIQHCVPNIKNAWHTPSIDLDLILIAIRLATYGEKMITPLTIGTETEMEYSVDLRMVMDNLLNQVTWESVVPITDELTVYVKPRNYKQISNNAIKTFETQKIIQIVNNENMPDEEKIRAFKESFNKLTDVTIGIVETSIYKVDTPSGSTENPQYIKEFMENADKEIFNAIQNHLEMLREKNTLKPIVVPVTEEMREKGYKGDTIEIPLVFDPSTFFV
jgi:hypothetical protein